jgi:hypothetical protein
LAAGKQLTERLFARQVTATALDMAFPLVDGGGRGLAEQYSGLPIDMRRVSCPMAQGNAGGMNKGLSSETTR